MDQIVADQIGGDTQNLSLRVQAASYIGGNSTAGDDKRISWRSDGNGGLKALDPIYSPELAFSKLFKDFAPSDPNESKAATLRKARHHSAVDLVAERSQQLISKLGYEDRMRMEQHYDELRALEERLKKVPVVGGGCTPPADPGDDPPIQGAAIEYKGQGGDGIGYSNEELRAQLLFDMIAKGFACDISRVAAVRMTISQCAMQTKEILGYEDEMHAFAHSPHPKEAMTDAVAWHVKHFARFVAKLRDTNDVDGNSLLDNTAVVLLFEGGYGYNPEADIEKSAHSAENMIALIGGHAGGLIPKGKHVAAKDVHPARVLVSAMKGVGMPEEKLGEVEGSIDGLFSA